MKVVRPSGGLICSDEVLPLAAYEPRNIQFQLTMLIPFPQSWFALAMGVREVELSSYTTRRVSDVMRGRRQCESQREEGLDGSL